MQQRRRVLQFLEILIPLLLALSFDLWPRTVHLQDALEASDLAQGDRFPQAASQHLQDILAVEPWRTDLWEQVGSYEFLLEEWDTSLEAFKAAQTAGELSPDGYFMMGKAYQVIEEVDLAASAFLKAAENGGIIEGYQRAAEIQRSRGNFERSAEILEMQLAQDTENAGVMFELAMLKTPSDPQAAFQYLEDVEQLEPDLQGASELKEEIYRATLEEDELYSRMLIGRALARQDEWDLAAFVFEQVTKTEPDYAEGWAFLGEAYYALGQDGLQELEHALELDPNSVSALSLLSLYWRRQNHPDQALVYLEKLTALLPEEPVWHYEIANVLADLDDLTAAVEHFQTAIALDPVNVDYWQSLAVFSITHGFEPRTMGLPAARKVLLLMPDNTHALNLMGWTLLNLGDLDSAERFLHRSLEEDPGNAAAYLHLGQLYLQADDFDSAQVNLWRAVNLTGESDPIGVTARRLLGK